jgi:hypothetical protein
MLPLQVFFTCKRNKGNILNWKSIWFVGENTNKGNKNGIIKNGKVIKQ